MRRKNKGSTKVEGGRIDTAQRRYNEVHYKMTLHTAPCWLKQNLIQSLNSQKTPHTSPSQASYGVYVLMILQRHLTVVHSWYLKR